MNDPYVLSTVKFLMELKQKSITYEWKELKQTYHWKFLNHLRGKGYWWFRIYGYGLSWRKINSRNDLLFSERNRRKGFLLYKWYFRFLSKNK